MSDTPASELPPVSQGSEVSYRKTARLAAMDMLARREHTAFELQQKLHKKYPEFDLDSIISPVIAQLQQDQLQSDTRFAEAFVRYRSGRGMGPVKIASELRPKGLDSDLVRAAMFADVDWAEKCYEVLTKKFSSSAAGSSQADKARWQRFLMQRGFDSEQCRSAIRRYLSGAADFD